jgi:hypothetical protein
MECKIIQRREMVIQQSKKKKLYVKANKKEEEKIDPTSVCGKYFDYSGVLPDCLNNPEEKIFRLLRLQDRRLRLHQLRLTMLGGSPSRTRVNYRQRSGARHQLAPECRKSSSRSTISSTSATRRSQQTLGGSTNNFASDRDFDSTTTTRLRHRRLHHADHIAPIKAKFSSSKKSIIIYFRHTQRSGAPP